MDPQEFCNTAINTKFGVLTIDSKSSVEKVLCSSDHSTDHR